MRAVAGLAVGALAACSAAPAAPQDLIDCALAGSGSFAHECAVERTKGADGLELTVRHPDGGFRRFVVTGDGTGLATADGADKAQVTAMEGGIEVAVGADRYRFPARLEHRGEQK